MVTITVKRIGKLEKPMGIGEGRISEGTLTKDWGTTVTEIKAGSLKLRTLSNVLLTPGTPLEAQIYARVVEPGSLDNTVRIRAALVQRGAIRIGTPRTTTYDRAFTGSPNIALAPGSPVTSPYSGSYTFAYVQAQTRTNFTHYGTPTYADSHYIAIGPGSFPINYIAVGD